MLSHCFGKAFFEFLPCKRFIGNIHRYFKIRRYHLASVRRAGCEMPGEECKRINERAAKAGKAPLIPRKFSCMTGSSTLLPWIPTNHIPCSNNNVTIAPARSSWFLISVRLLRSGYRLFWIRFSWFPIYACRLYYAWYHMLRFMSGLFRRCFMR